MLVTSDETVAQERAAHIKAALEKAGFKIVIKPIPADGYLDTVKKKDNPYDIWVDSWAADWPSGAAILPVLFDGRSIKDEGNSNTSQLNDAGDQRRVRPGARHGPGRPGRRVGASSTSGS